MKTNPIPEQADQKLRTRLATIQGVGLSIEGRIASATTELHRAQGVVAGLIAAERGEVAGVMSEVQTEIDAGTLDGDAAKPILRWLQRVRDRLAAAAQANNRAVAKQEGVIEGLAKSVDECEGLFRQEEGRAQRQANEADRGNRDDGGRPIPLRERRGEELEPAAAKPKTRRSKKAT